MNRRHFIGSLALTLTAGSLMGKRSDAATPPLLSEDDPAAKALGYVHDAASLDPSVRPAANLCANCRLYQSTDGPLGGCAIFPGKQVAAKGWCKGWVAGD